ncbi:MAG: transglutaminase domain-containing protein [Desulfobaccales bacterium]|nr:transglutaminase domain-containing protein [Desulfobaccales bacterium]
MKRILFLLNALFFFAMVNSAWSVPHSGLVTMDFDLSVHEGGKEVKLWIPYPVSDKEQLISDIKVSGDCASSAVYTDRTYGNPILFARWNKDAKSHKLTLSFAVERQEIITKDFPEKETAWDSIDYKPYLGASRLCPIDGEVKKLADEIIKGKKTVQAKARAIYEWVCQNMYRDPDTRGCGKGDVRALLVKPGGKCTDISSVFVALSRAAGIPAREIFGIRLGKKPEEDITQYQHCWAEFYLPGYGWVPVDPADVRKAMLVENLKLEDEKTSMYKTYFWGGIDPYRIKLSVGRDIVLTPPQSGQPLNTFGYPFAQVGDNTLDWLEPSTFKYRFIYGAN